MASPRTCSATWTRATSTASCAAGEIQLKTPEQGAATSVYVATAPELEGVGGRYYEDCAESPVVDRRENQGVARYALDPENADRLWALSEAAVGRHVTVG